MCKYYYLSRFLEVSEGAAHSQEKKSPTNIQFIYSDEVLVYSFLNTNNRSGFRPGDSAISTFSRLLGPPVENGV